MIKRKTAHFTLIRRIMIEGKWKFQFESTSLNRPLISLSLHLWGQNAKLFSLYFIIIGFVDQFACIPWQFSVSRNIKGSKQYFENWSASGTKEYLKQWICVVSKTVEPLTSSFEFLIPLNRLWFNLIFCKGD